MLNDNAALQALKARFEQGRVRKEGTVRSTERGFGFLECEDRESFFIAPRYMRSLMHGDRVAATITPGERDRSQAVPDALLEPALTRFMARVRLAGGALRVVSLHPSIRMEIPAEDGRSEQGAVLGEGDYVVCQLTAHALRDRSFRARITEFVATAADPQAPWSVSLRALDLPLEPPPADADCLVFHDEGEREDLTDLPLVTIDSPKTRDMDDALCAARRDGGGFVLHVAIADPSAYILPGSRLDRMAAQRAFSIYLPGRDVPMLPRELAEDLCSLREGELRPVLAVRLEIGSDGALVTERTRFMLARIRSRRRLNYAQVSDFIELGTPLEEGGDPEVTASLTCLHELAQARDQYRQRHGAAFRSRPEYEFVLTPDGALDHIEIVTRRAGNQIVEECMIAANLAAGQVLATACGGGVFNVHEGFDPRFRRELETLLPALGFAAGDDSALRSIEGFCAARRFANEQSSPYLDCRIRKLQQFTRISAQPGPHFALGVENYATFTSPIRKYSDIINHRLLKAHARGVHDEALLPAAVDIERMNVARRLCRSAEREVRDWLYIGYLRPGLEQGRTYHAEVFDISRSGMRLLLTECGAVGFMPGSLLCADRRLFELSGATGELLVGREVRLRLGDELEVRIAELREETHSIVLAPAAGGIAGLPLPADAGS